ncbi:ATPase domain-containing protein [Desulfohalovibrio reitneri]|uniref:ATPase domain-containing protein n=1 Tax=Desulfohalovibrio reitneri TaxID=1307759 RepID=UPI000A596482|nr:ATPase domain-containing protein [Desulfohalovibrio reitneri]
MSEKRHQVEKLATGIPGFDHISDGGLPKNRTTLVSGSAGSAKTVFGSQFLVEGIKRGEGGVFVTFEEEADDIRSNLLSLGWDIDRLERENKWAFVDASPCSTTWTSSPAIMISARFLPAYSTRCAR